MQPARIAAALVSLAFCARAEDLLQELSRRSATEGLALIHWNGVPVSVLTFDGASQATWSSPFLPSQSVPKTPYLSNAWFSATGDAVAWSHHDWSRSFPCPDPLIVEPPNATSWQIPGSAINLNALGISADGSQVAFDGTYKPPGVGYLNSRANRARWLTGLFHADSKTNEVTRIAGSCGTTSISWSPDGSAITFDCHDQILIYNFRNAKSSLISNGSTPSWSPDGRWIAFRHNGRAAAIDLPIMKTKPLMGGRAIQWGLHWSPDSRYIMASQQVGLFEEIIHWNFDPLSDAPAKLVIERLEDGAISDRLWFSWGGDDRGYYWITNYQTFLKKAMQPVEVNTCP